MTSYSTMKKSRQREAILRCVLSRRDHPTADAVYMDVRERFPSISLGTVYRNLSLLTDLGKITKITCEDRTDRFDGDVTPHSHFICNVCGQLYDFFYYPDDSFFEKRNQEFDGDIQDCTLIFRGICKECKENKNF
ncbi:MAG: transcriptional repressor [Eubacteriales bacterium]|nr:transcriptional repressor [Eubacteriales bacterium]